MAYSIITLRGALKEMAVASTAKPWVWQANTAAVNPKLQPKLKKEIEGFDKSKLRSAKLPR